ncbi:MAG: alpha/beta hydrolase [Tuberibacillus sp.]
MWVWKTKTEVPRGTVVIVHGAGEHHGRYEWLKDKFLACGFHVVMGDLPGQGKNPRKRGHIDRFDEMIEAVSKWIKTAEVFNEPILLFGHSMGGLSVIRTLQETGFQPRAVILSSPCLGLVFPPPGWLVKMVKPLNTIAPSIRVTTKKPTGKSLATQNKEVLSRDAKDPLMVRKVSIRWYFELEKAMQLAAKQVHRFPDIPLFIFQAGSDKIVDKRAVRHWFDQLSISKKYYKEWSGLYHEIFNEPEREDVFRHLLKKIEPYF